MSVKMLFRDQRRRNRDRCWGRAGQRAVHMYVLLVHTVFVELHFVRRQPELAHTIRSKVQFRSRSSYF